MLPRDIGNLFHLRYLNINEYRIKSVSFSIGNLRFLQTLDLRTYFDLVEIPNVLWRLEQLRHLYLPLEIKQTGKSKFRLDGLSKLETLDHFDTENCDVRYFPKLTNLRKVKVFLKTTKDLAVILKSPILLNNLNSILLPSLSFRIRIIGDFLTEEEQSLLRQLLGSHHLHKLFLRGSLNLFNKFPDQFPANLTDLTLWDTKLEEDPMPTLEKFPNLRTLILRENSYIGKEIVCSSAPPPPTTTAPSSSSGGGGGGGGGYSGCDGGGFPKLISLHLWSIEILEEWRVEQGAMLCLFRLQIIGCKKLKEVSDGLRFITTLRELDIKYVAEALIDRVRERGEDFTKSSTCLPSY
ncbi:putative disease resistance protein [Camellia lanceoleosa]|uniref:Disease resistance protein n=1 Tax=Camellia lanceoleosa TaxID=1840588 RepID=A0ACC0IIM5_9ERIC|nr:putative disease resistance protein [Camellia lanceoleosa]